MAATLCNAGSEGKRLQPISLTSTMARFNTIAVHITLEDSGGIERHVVLPNIKRPVEYKVLAERISRYRDL